MTGTAVQSGQPRFQPRPIPLEPEILTGPDRLQVSDPQGLLATLTVGAKTVIVRGQGRTFTEQKKPFLDDFQRTFSPEFGQSPGGGTWRSLTGTESKFSVDGSKAIILMDSANVSRWCSLFDEDIGDFNARTLATLDEAPTGASCSFSLAWGYTSSSNNYRARLLINTTGSVQLVMEKEVSGTVTNLGAATTLGTGYAANDKWHIRAERTGNTIRCRAWKDGTSEPSSWTHSTTDTAHMTGRLGFRSTCSSGNTNQPYNCLIYEFGADSCQWANPPTVTHDTWVRVLEQPYGGGWTNDLARQIRHWAQDCTPDALAYAFMFVGYTPAVTDAELGGGVQVYGTAGYGPLQPDGTRFEFSDFNDYLGLDWTFVSGESRTFPHGDIDETLNVDCSGFVRMVYGYRLGIPMTFDNDFNGINLPRRTRDIGPDGPGVIIAQATGTAPAITDIQIGDIVLFDADSTGEPSGQIDHNGIYVGIDSNGDPRFISSRKVCDGPTFGDLGGASLLNGSGTYATRLRIIRRF